MKKVVYTICINPDTSEGNANKEQYKRLQKDGQTIEVPIGKFVDVPQWVAVRAKEIGWITDYRISETDA